MQRRPGGVINSRASRLLLPFVSCSVALSRTLEIISQCIMEQRKTVLTLGEVPGDSFALSQLPI